MYTHVHACTYICTCTHHVHACTCMSTHAHMHTCTHVYRCIHMHNAHTCMHMYIHVYTCTMHTHAQTCTHTYIHMYTHMSTHVYTCTHMYTHVHTCIYTHTSPRSRPGRAMASAGSPPVPTLGRGSQDPAASPLPWKPARSAGDGGETEKSPLGGLRGRGKEQEGRRAQGGSRIEGGGGKIGNRGRARGTAPGPPARPGR